MGAFENGPFEEEWRGAFEGVEVMPNERVWNNIDRELNNGSYKKRLLVLYWLVAASVAFAAVVGGTGLYINNFNNKTNETVSENGQTEGLLNSPQQGLSENDPGPKEESPFLSEAHDMKKEDNLTAIAAPPQTTSSALLKTEKKSNSLSHDNKTANTLRQAYNPEESREGNMKTETGRANVVAETQSNAILPHSQNEQYKLTYQKNQSHPHYFYPGPDSKDNNFRNIQNSPKLNGDDLTFPAFPNENTNGLTKYFTSVIFKNTWGLKTSAPEDEKGREELFAENNMQSIPVTEKTKQTGPGLLAGSLTRAEPMGFSDPEIEAPDIHGVYATWLAPQNNRLVKGDIWAGLNLAGGGYDPSGSGLNNYTARAMEVNLTSSNVPGFASMDENVPLTGRIDVPGNAVTYGVGIGKQITKKWHVQSGIDIATYHTGRYTGNGYYSQDASLSDIENSINDGTANGSQHHLQKNIFSYVSVPVKLGYKFLDRNIGVMLASGVVSNILALSNYEALASSDPRAGTAPVDVNPITFWGSLGAEFSYHLGEHYIVALTPNYRMAMNAIEKDTGNKPSFAEVGVSMRYIFD